MLVRSALGNFPCGSEQGSSSQGTLPINIDLMWEILQSSSEPLGTTSTGEGVIFDLLETSEPSTSGNETIETAVYHCFKPVDTSDGGQALPPFSCNVHDRPFGSNPEQEIDNRSHSASANCYTDQFLQVTGTTTWPFLAASQGMAFFNGQDDQLLDISGYPNYFTSFQGTGYL